MSEGPPTEDELATAFREMHRILDAYSQTVWHVVKESEKTLSSGDFVVWICDPNDATARELARGFHADRYDQYEAHVRKSAAKRGARPVFIFGLHRWRAEQEAAKVHQPLAEALRSPPPDKDQIWCVANLNGTMVGKTVSFVRMTARNPGGVN